MPPAVRLSPSSHQPLAPRPQRPCMPVARGMAKEERRGSAQAMHAAACPSPGRLRRLDLLLSPETPACRGRLRSFRRTEPVGDPLRDQRVRQVRQDASSHKCGPDLKQRVEICGLLQRRLSVGNGFGPQGNPSPVGIPPWRLGAGELRQKASSRECKSRRKSSWPITTPQHQRCTVVINQNRRHEEPIASSKS